MYKVEYNSLAPADVFGMKAKHNVSRGVFVQGLCKTGLDSGKYLFNFAVLQFFYNKIP